MNDRERELRRLDRALEKLANEPAPEVDPERQLAAIRARLEARADEAPSSSSRRQVALTAAAAAVAIFATGWWAFDRWRAPSVHVIVTAPAPPARAGSPQPPAARLAEAFAGLSATASEADLRAALETFLDETEVTRVGLGELLRTSLEEGDVELRRAALACAVAVDSIESRALLVHGSYDPELAHEALVALAEAAPREVERALLDERFDDALAALARRGDRGALLALDEGLRRTDPQHEPERAASLLGAIFGFGEAGTQVVARGRRLSDESWREALTSALEAIETPARAHGAIALLDESGLRAAAARALGRVGSPRALGELVRGFGREGRDDLGGVLATAVAQHESAWLELATTSEAREAVELLEVLIEFGGSATATARVALAYRTELPIDARLLALDSLRNDSDVALAEALRRIPELPRSDRRLAAAAVVHASERFGIESVLDALGARGSGRDRLTNVLAEVGERSPSGLVRVSRELASAVRFDTSPLHFQP